MAACRFSERALALAVVFACCSVALAHRSLLSTCSMAFPGEVDTNGWDKIDWHKVYQNFGDCYGYLRWGGFEPYEKYFSRRGQDRPDICKNPRNGFTFFAEDPAAVLTELQASAGAAGEEASEMSKLSKPCRCVALCKLISSQYLVDILCSCKQNRG